MTKQRDRRGGGRGAATAREQPTARRDTQTRRERTESRESGGQQIKQPTAPRPGAPRAGNQKKPEAHNEREKKNRAARGNDENPETRKGEGRAATTREQPKAGRETQTSREGTDSREAGGEQNKQHTAPRPKAPGPETKESQRQRARTQREKKPNHRPGGGGGKKNKAPRPYAAGAGNQRKQETKGARGRRKKKAKKKGGGRVNKGRANKGPTKGQLQPEGGRANQKERAARGEGEAHQNAPGRPTRQTRPGRTSTRTHTHTHGTRAWRPPTRKGRCRRPHETAPVHRPSPPSNDGRYGKPDASVTVSTHANQRSASSPRPTPEGPARDNPIVGLKRVRRGAGPAPLPRRVPAAGTMSLVLGQPPRAPRSRPVNPGAKADGMGKGTTASGKPTGAPRATGPDEARRTTRGHESRQRVTPPATNTAHRQVPSNNGRRVPQTRTARAATTRPRPRSNTERGDEAKQRQTDRTPRTGSSGAGQAAGTAAPWTGASNNQRRWTPPGQEHQGRNNQQAPRGATEAATGTRPWRCSEAAWRTRPGRSGENKMRTRPR